MGSHTDATALLEAARRSYRLTERGTLILPLNKTRAGIAGKEFRGIPEFGQLISYRGVRIYGYTSRKAEF